MKYQIEVWVPTDKAWRLIAKFAEEIDRDVCLNAFQEFYSDSKFRMINK